MTTVDWQPVKDYSEIIFERAGKIAKGKKDVSGAAYPMPLSDNRLSAAVQPQPLYP